MTTASRYHDFSAGHRVVGHENRCRMVHGHNYRAHFECAGTLDDLGRVIDFGVIKERLCQWLEDHWDHRLLLWSQDPLGYGIAAITPESVVEVPFNPTAENMAEHLLRVIGPAQLEGTGVRLIRCTVEETRKCSATATLEAI